MVDKCKIELHALHRIVRVWKELYWWKVSPSGHGAGLHMLFLAGENIVPLNGGFLLADLVRPIGWVAHHVMIAEGTDPLHKPHTAINKPPKANYDEIFFFTDLKRHTPEKQSNEPCGDFSPSPPNQSTSKVPAQKPHLQSPNHLHPRTIQHFLGAQSIRSFSQQPNKIPISSTLPIGFLDSGLLQNAPSSNLWSKIEMGLLQLLVLLENGGVSAANRIGIPWTMMSSLSAQDRLVYPRRFGWSRFAKKRTLMCRSVLWRKVLK